MQFKITKIKFVGVRLKHRELRLMSLRLSSFSGKDVDRSKNDTVHMFYKHKHFAFWHMCIQFFLQFLPAFPSKSAKPVDG